MGFQLVTTVKGAVKDSRASVSYRKPNSKHGRGRQPRLVIGIPKGVAAAFKPKAGEGFGIFLGDGKESGIARILPSIGGIKPKLLKGGVIFHFGFVPMLGGDAAEKEFVEVKPFAEGFEIALPPWFKPEQA